MSLRNIAIVYRKELTDSLRDRRTLISMIVVPIVLMPVMTIGVGVLTAKIIGEAMKEAPRVMVVGGEDSPGVMEKLRRLKTIHLVPARPDFADLISNKRIRAAVEIPKGFEEAQGRGEVPTVQIDIYQGELRSTIAAQRLEQFFRGLRDTQVRERLVARGLSGSLVKPFEITEKNVASAEKVFGNTFGALLPYLVIVLCLTGAMYPAIDLTAGEKERGTIETILCSPVSRTHLVLGKFLMVLTASLATSALATCSMAATFFGAREVLAGLAADQSNAVRAAIHPSAILAIFLMVLPVAVLLSAGLLAIALFAKSYKEAQSYISPLILVVIIPAVVALLPGVELNARLALVPVLNTSLVSKEIITGTYHWRYMALIFASSCVYAAGAIFLAVKMFQREDVLFRT
jgi:sodium transport system permease protein